MVATTSAGLLIFLSIQAKNATLSSLIEISYPLFTAFFAWVLVSAGDDQSRDGDRGGVDFYWGDYCGARESVKKLRHPERRRAERVFLRQRLPSRSRQDLVVYPRTRRPREHSLCREAKCLSFNRSGGRQSDRLRQSIG